MLQGLVNSATSVNTLVAGDSLVWTFSGDPDHLSSDGWTCAFDLSRNGINLLEVAATADGDNWNVGLLTTDTSDLTPGYVQAYLVFTKSEDRATLFAGDLTVLPDPAGSLSPTPSMAALAAVKNTITLIVSQPEVSASFNGQSYTLQNIKDLMDIRNQLQAEVNSELRALGVDLRTNFRTILTRFT